MSELAKIIVLTPEELESLLERAAERGAIRALAGNHNGNGHAPEDRLVSAEDAAKFLGYSKDWVYRHWKKIGGRKIGVKGLRFSRHDLERWAASRKPS
jgi:predicted DNA-binding transcriptional regulator AlpA